MSTSRDVLIGASALPGAAALHKRNATRVSSENAGFLTSPLQRPVARVGRVTLLQERDWMSLALPNPARCVGTFRSYSVCFSWLSLTRYRVNVKTQLAQHRLCL